MLNTKIVGRRWAYRLGLIASLQSQAKIILSFLNLFFNMHILSDC